MSVVDGFIGSDLKDLISAPLSAAADAGFSLAESTAQFIEQMGFDCGNRLKIASFGYKQKTEAPDGNLSENEMKLDIPLLSIVPIPNLQTDEVNIKFDVEIKSSVRMSGERGGVNIKGCIAAGSGSRGGYHVDVKAVQCGVSDGLTRVLDIMAASISPSIVSARAVDESGAELRGGDKEKHDKIKLLSSECKRLERAVNSAHGNYSIRLGKLTESAKIRRDKILGELRLKLCTISVPEGMSEDSKRIIEDERNGIIKKAEKLESFWNSFIATGANTAVLINSTGNAASLQAGFGSPNDEKGIPDLSDFEEMFRETVAAAKKLNAVTENYNMKKYELNSVLIEEY